MSWMQKVNGRMLVLEQELITKLTNFLETKDWSLVLNTTVGDSYIQDDSDEDIPITVQDLSIAQVMDLTMRATLLVQFYTALNSCDQRPNMKDVAENVLQHTIPKVSSKTLLKWKRAFEMGGFTFIPSRKGKYQRPWILDDEAMKLSARTFIMEHAAPKGLPNMKVTDFQDFVNTTLLKDISVKSLNGICAPISEETARKWLYRLGCRSKYLSSGVYYDGHDREDVIEYRKRWLARRLVSENFLPLYLHLSVDEAKSLLCKKDPQNGEKIECDQMLISEAMLPKECWISPEQPLLEFHVDDERFDFSMFRMDKDKYPHGGVWSRKVDQMQSSSK